MYSINHKILPVYKTSNKSIATLISEFKSKVQLNKPNNILRVGSFNIYKYREGNTTAIQGAMYQVLENKIDICGIQEFGSPAGFDSIGVTKIPGAYDYVLDGTFASHHEMKNCELIPYKSSPSNQTQHYFRVDIVINGKTVRMYNTHLDAYDPIVTKAEMQELALAVKSDPSTYKIVVGDFNTRDSNVYNIFANMGYKLAIPVSEGLLDNIFYSPTIQMLSSEIIPTPPSITDHDLIYAELQLL